MTELSRRKFIQLTVLGSAVAAGGCDTHAHSRYAPGLYQSEVAGTYGGYDNRVWPYENQPDGMLTGVPQYFATACQMCPAGCGLYVRTMNGRALQIQGNPLHPVSMGKVCARGIGSLQYLYNPDRLRFPKARAPRTAAWSEPGWDAALAQATAGLQNAKGRVAVLADGISLGQSPSLMRLAGEFARAAGGTLTTYSLLDDTPWRAAAKTVYGTAQVPAYRLDEADVIVSFGGDFLEAWPSPVLYNRQYGDFRQGPRRTNMGQRGTFIYVGPRMSQTAANADLWLPCNPGTEAVVAAAVAGTVSAAAAAQASGLTEQQITDLTTTFKGAGPRAVAVAGNGLLTATDPTAAFTAVESLNRGSQCVGIGTPAIPAPAAGTATATSGYKAMQALIGAMNAGTVGALVILGQPNPAFTLPAADGFAQAMTKVPFVLALTPFEDETTVGADVLLPTRTFLEEWGDNVPLVVPAGTTVATLQQPIVDPQFIGGHGQATDHTVPFVPWMDTRPLGDLLATLAGRLGTPLPDADARSAVRKTWAGIGQADLTQTDLNNDTKWVAALAAGGAWRTATGAGTPTAGAAAGIGGASGVTAGAPPQDGKYSLQIYPHIYWTDGRGANVPWHQEVADPMTMGVWNSWVEINAAVAHQLDIRTGDVVRLTSDQGSLEALAVPSPGIHPGAVAMPIGQGHSAYGRYANDRGANPLAILAPTADPTTGALAYGATRVRLTKVASAQGGYNGNSTLVLLQDIPGGHEPDAVKKLIHETAKERSTARKENISPA